MIRNNFLRLFFLPIYFTFQILVWLKNKFFDIGLFKSFTPQIYTITVGNLAVGGTGKTPMVEYLTNLFVEKFNIAILSRGYGRNAKGFIHLNQDYNAKNVGDEPMQYFNKFHPKANVFVGEDRVASFKKIRQILPNANLLLLDDAFQHRAIKAHTNIILTDYNNLIFNDLMMPFGQLREPIASLNRAQILIITKCPPELSISEAEEIKLKFLKYSKATIEVFFAKIVYSNPIQFSGIEKMLPTKLVLVAGIANADSFINYCNKNWEIVNQFILTDHHKYTLENINKIEQSLEESMAIITTEKDFVKLNGQLSPNISAFYLPISVEFMFDKESYFTGLIKNKIDIFYRNI